MFSFWLSSLNIYFNFNRNCFAFLFYLRFAFTFPSFNDHWIQKWLEEGERETERERGREWVSEREDKMAFKQTLKIQERNRLINFFTYGTISDSLLI